MRLFTAAVILIIATSTASGQTFEQSENRVCSPDIGNCRAVARELVSLVEAYGYKCSSISFINKWVFSRGFTIQCNHHAYEYEVKDKGGRWVVTYVD